MNTDAKKSAKKSTKTPEGNQKSIKKFESDPSNVGNTWKKAAQQNGKPGKGKKK